MPRLRVHAFSLSLDGYGAGRKPNIDNPFGAGDFQHWRAHLGYAPADT